MYSEITVSVSPLCEHLDTSWIHQAIHSTRNSFTVCVVGRDARMREAMRVFGASVHSEPILRYSGHQGERVVLEAGFNDLKVFSWGQLMQFVEQLKDLG
jgi:hypothetical protein